jgi:hypothetical protein
MNFFKLKSVMLMVPTLLQLENVTFDSGLDEKPSYYWSSALGQSFPHLQSFTTLIPQSLPNTYNYIPPLRQLHEKQCNDPLRRAEKIDADASSILSLPDPFVFEGRGVLICIVAKASRTAKQVSITVHQGHPHCPTITLPESDADMIASGTYAVEHWTFVQPNDPYPTELQLLVSDMHQDVVDVFYVERPHYHPPPSQASQIPFFQQHQPSYPNDYNMHNYP